MAPLLRTGISTQIRYQRELSAQRTGFLELREKYSFPGSKTLREWKKSAPDQESARNFGQILHADKTCHEGFRRIARIGDGTGENQHDDRVAIGLILNAINSDKLAVKQTGLAYMQALLSQPMTPQKTRFVYDSIVNNLINAVGWTIEERQDYHSGRQILSQLDDFSLLILRQYNIYPNLDLPSLLQERQMPNNAIEGMANFNDIHAYLHARLSSAREAAVEGSMPHESEPLNQKIQTRSGHSGKMEVLRDYESFRDFPQYSTLIKRFFSGLFFIRV